MDCSYWKDIIARLKDGDDWAAHVLSTDVDEYWNLSEAKKCVADEEIVEAAILGFENPSSQPYCDEILGQFDGSVVHRVYSKVTPVTDTIRQSVERFFDL